MSKLCKFVKKNKIKDNLDEYLRLVSDPKYICLKCGRTSKDKKNLCDPKKI